MSRSCCCCVTASGVRTQERLVRRQEEEEEEEEDSRRNMDISLLREQYRSTRETQRRRTQVLLLRTVSEELSEAVSIIPVTQGLTSPWKPNSSSPPAVTFDPDPTTSDPWHAHLGLHRRCCPGVTAHQLAASSPETTNTISPSRRSSSSSESVCRNVSVDSAPGSPCSSACSTKEEDAEETHPVQLPPSASLLAAEPHPSAGPAEDRPAGSDESSAPVASVSRSPSCSISSLHEDLRDGPSAGRDGSSRAWRALRFTRQLSVGGVGSSAGVQQNQSYQPFPHRKNPRISEAARRLGMYSSF